MNEGKKVIVGYDPDVWAREFDYANHPLEAALATVEAVRGNTAPILGRLPNEAWAKEGTHTESGRYTASDWLRIYSGHLEEHLRQINRTVDAWRSVQRASSVNTTVGVRRRGRQQALRNYTDYP